MKNKEISLDPKYAQRGVKIKESIMKKTLVILLAMFLIICTACTMSFNVEFIGFDGTVLKSCKVDEGKTVTAPEAPEVEGYRFVGWDVDFSSVTANLKINAVYERIGCKVRFLDHSGNVLATISLFYGEALSSSDIPSAEEVDAADERIGFRFIGWDKETDMVVTEDVDFTAQYEAVNVYSVYFHTFMGEIIHTVQVEENGKVEAIEGPNRDGWRFLAWVKNNVMIDVFDFDSEVTEDLHLFASYEMIYLTVKFVDYDGTVIRQSIFPWGLAIPDGFEPTEDFMNAVYPREGYKFVGWDKDPADISMITEDLTFTAVYEKL